MFVPSTFYLFLLLCSCNIIDAKIYWARRVVRSPQTTVEFPKASLNDVQDQSADTGHYQNQTNEQAQDAQMQSDQIDGCQVQGSDQSNQAQNEENLQIESGQDQGSSYQNQSETGLSDTQGQRTEAQNQQFELAKDMQSVQTTQANEYQEQGSSNVDGGQNRPEEGGNQYSNQENQADQTENIDGHKTEGVDQIGDAQGNNIDQVEENQTEGTENMNQTGQMPQVKVDTLTVSNNNKRRRSVKTFFRRMD